MTALTLGGAKLPPSLGHTNSTKVRFMGPGWQRDVAVISRQAKPWIHRLPYQREILTNSGGWDWGGLELLNQQSSAWIDLWDEVYAKAYDKFYRDLGTQAQTVMNAMELPQTVQLFRDSMRTIASTARYLKRGDVRMVYRTLAVDPTAKQHKRLQKSVTVSNKWLALQFAILPVVQDIGNCIEVFQRDFPSDALSATKQVGRPFHASDGGKDIEGACTLSARLMANVKISNPNLFLANQMGFINPSAVAWDALPGSFILDWMLPVGKFCNSLSNNYGLELVEPTVSRMIKGHAYGTHSGTFGTAEGFTLVRTPQSFITPGLLDRVHLPKVSLWLLTTEASLAIKSLANLFER